MLGAGAAVWAAGGVRPEERIAALGFSEADTATLSAHFHDAESRGKLGHGLSAIDWLETLPDLHPDAAPAARARGARLRALGRRTVRSAT